MKMTEMQTEIGDLDITRKSEYNTSISVCLETLPPPQPGQGGGIEAMVWDTDEADLLGCICKSTTMRSPCSQYIHRIAHTDTAYSVINESLCGCASAYLPYPHDPHRILGTSNCEDNPCICCYAVCDSCGLLDSYDNAMQLLYVTASTDALFREGMYELPTTYIKTTPANSLWSVIFDEPSAYSTRNPCPCTRSISHSLTPSYSGGRPAANKRCIGPSKRGTPC